MAPKELDNQLSNFSEAGRSKAMERFRVIQPFLDYGVPLTEAIKGTNISVRTGRRWVQAYRREGLVGLLKLRRTDFGTSDTPQSVRELIEGLALSQPRQSKAAIHRRAINFSKEHGIKPLSYTTVRAIISKLGFPLRHLAQEGKKSFMDKYDLIYRRTASRPNEIWQADHTPLDIIVLDTKGQSARPWLTVILDDHSRAVCGYLIGFDAPCAINTALTLYQAIWRKADPEWHLCGIPEKFYTDHGSDFTSVTLLAL
jgi:putative transposase